MDDWSSEFLEQVLSSALVRDIVRVVGPYICSALERMNPQIDAHVLCDFRAYCDGAVQIMDDSNLLNLTNSYIQGTFADLPQLTLADLQRCPDADEKVRFVFKHLTLALQQHHAKLMAAGAIFTATLAINCFFAITYVRELHKRVKADVVLDSLLRDIISGIEKIGAPETDSTTRNKETKQVRKDIASVKRILEADGFNGKLCLLWNGVSLAAGLLGSVYFFSQAVWTQVGSKVTYYLYGGACTVTALGHGYGLTLVLDTLTKIDKHLMTVTTQENKLDRDATSSTSSDTVAPSTPSSAAIGN